MKILRAIAITSSLLVFSGCGRQASQSSTEKPTVRLQQEWFPYSGFAGEVSGAKRFAPANGINLVVQPGSEQVDPIKLVLAGTAPIGVVGGDLLVAAVAKGAPLVAIGVVNQHSPTVFLVPKNSEIKQPRDFVGHKVGIWRHRATWTIARFAIYRTASRNDLHIILCACTQPASS
jgi:NitT/TauT family transport system substrate-binding protein